MSCGVLIGLLASERSPNGDFWHLAPQITKSVPWALESDTVSRSVESPTSALPAASTWLLSGLLYPAARIPIVIACWSKYPWSSPTYQPTKSTEGIQFVRNRTSVGAAVVAPVAPLVPVEPEV